MVVGSTEMKFTEGEWKRGELIGSGSFARVYKATTNPKQNYMPPLIAAKSAAISKSFTTSSIFLAKESVTLAKLQGNCPHIIGFYGPEVTIDEKGKAYFNMLLEYASLGTLGDRIRQKPGGIPEPEVQRYARMILQGLKYVHEHEYVHCDIKPDNILLVPSSANSSSFDAIPKIADFGLAKKVGKRLKRNQTGVSLWGTALYVAPESVRYNEFEPHSDVWAFGISVLEMLTGKQAWTCDDELSGLLHRVGYSDELPEIPSMLSSTAQDFVRRCLVKNSLLRWSVDMLLDHPFVAINNDKTEAGALDDAALGIPKPQLLDWREIMVNVNSKLDANSRLTSPVKTMVKDRKHLECGRRKRKPGYVICESIRRMLHVF
ncbi:hypothetical protein IFM89_036132 [Coptis chinensis]|uniref:Protein kinase domain-containing protein n=1 Tax=Coptis chinensis TaxID=261450 RepID=A0A835HSG1_9MAGN|nr:hypothetical protein IFM89_036124 [Coptis chinensis]KAF9603431.1 hypothetical protein IFM89_036132 [Coptis chinensis]